MEPRPLPTEETHEQPLQGPRPVAAAEIEKESAFEKRRSSLPTGSREEGPSQQKTE